MMTTILIILGIIIFTFFVLNVGYKMAMLRWEPKDMMEKLDKFNAVNQELTNGIKRLDDMNKHLEEVNKQKDSWYMAQLQNLGQYMKEKHNDNYVFDQLKFSGVQMPEKTEPTELNIDSILDKASEFGFDSLTEEELDYLKNHK
jgi:predicted transcriptional regulator